MESVDERSLIHRAQQGDRQAWDELVRRYMKEAYYLSLKLSGHHQDAEDISQDAFVRIYGSLARFRQETSFKNWLYKIILNLFINRKKKASRVLLDSDLRTHSLPVTEKIQEPKNAVLTEESQRVIRGKINLLPERQKAVLTLYTYEGCSCDQIAELLGISYESVKMNLSLARKRMREELKGYLKKLNTNKTE